MNRKVFHVKSDGSAWCVKRAGARRADSFYGKKSDAIARAKALAKAPEPGQVKVHGRNGRLQCEFTYGRDPRSTAG
jgi:hypothetical protein